MRMVGVAVDDVGDKSAGWQVKSPTIVSLQHVERFTAVNVLRRARLSALLRFMGDTAGCERDCLECGRDRRRVNAIK